MIYLFQATYHIQNLDPATVSHVELTAGKFKKRVAPTLGGWNNVHFPVTMLKQSDGSYYIPNRTVNVVIIYVDGKPSIGDCSALCGGGFQPSDAPCGSYDEPVSVKPKKNKKQKNIIYANPTFLSISGQGPAKEVQRKG